MNEANHHVVSPKDEKEGKPDKHRGHWGSKWEFLLSCIGYSVGLGNIWRFPYLAYQNGGGAFMLPYVIFVFLIGKPLYLLEVSLGQFSQRGPVKVWDMAPLFRGIGMSMLVSTSVVVVYYNTLMAYTLFYLFCSWQTPVPWSTCEDWWGASNATCYVRTRNMSEVKGGCEDGSGSGNANCTAVRFQSSSEQFWEKYVLSLQIEGLTTFGDIGSPRSFLILCSLLSWLILFMGLFKGIKSSGKAVYFTSTFPYVILFILFVKGLTLEGAIEGVKYLFIPEWKKLYNPQVWRKALEQVFFSLGISWGSLINFGSYNDFHNKVHVDAMIVSVMDFLTSLLAGVVIFSVLGNWSVVYNIPIDKVAREGQGLAFVTYPEALSHLPVPQLWATLFFCMLFTLGLSSQFGMVESILSAIKDKHPRARSYKSCLALVACLGFFLLGLPTLFEGGQFVMDIMDTYGGGVTIMLIAVFEASTISWVYGANRFCDDLHLMLRFRPGWYWRFCWSVITPLGIMDIKISCLPKDDWGPPDECVKQSPDKSKDDFCYDNTAM